MHVEGGSPSLDLQFLTEPNRRGGGDGCKHVDESEDLTPLPLLRGRLETGPESWSTPSRDPLEPARAPAWAPGLCSALYLMTSILVHRAALHISSWTMAIRMMFSISPSSALGPSPELPSERSGSARHFRLLLSCPPPPGE